MKNTKKVISLSIVKDGFGNKFEFEDNTSNFEVEDLTAILGFLTSFIHNLQHLHAMKHNEWNNKLKN